jgi:hypothetical protein
VTVLQNQPLQKQHQRGRTTNSGPAYAAQAKFLANNEIHISQNVNFGDAGIVRKPRSLAYIGVYILQKNASLGDVLVVGEASLAYKRTYIIQNVGLGSVLAVYKLCFTINKIRMQKNASFGNVTAVQNPRSFMNNRTYIWQKNASCGNVGDVWSLVTETKEETTRGSLNPLVLTKI